MNKNKKKWTVAASLICAGILAQNVQAQENTVAMDTVPVVDTVTATPQANPIVADNSNDKSVGIFEEESNETEPVSAVSESNDWVMKIEPEAGRQVEISTYPYTNYFTMDRAAGGYDKLVAAAEANKDVIGYRIIDPMIDYMGRIFYDIELKTYADSKGGRYTDIFGSGISGLGEDISLSDLDKKYPDYTRTFEKINSFDRGEGQGFFTDKAEVESFAQKELKETDRTGLLDYKIVDADGHGAVYLLYVKTKTADDVKTIQMDRELLGKDFYYFSGNEEIVREENSGKYSIFGFKTEQEAKDWAESKKSEGLTDYEIIDLKAIYQSKYPGLNLRSSSPVQGLKSAEGYTINFNARTYKEGLLLKEKLLAAIKASRTKAQPEVKPSEQPTILTDAASKISISGSEKALNGAVKLDVKPVTDISAAALMGKKFDIYDLTPLDKDGNKVHVEGDITVTLPIKGKAVKVYYVLGNMTESLPFTQDDTTVSFIVTHFSQYAVVYDESQAPSDNSVIENYVPNQADNSYAAPAQFAAMEEIKTNKPTYSRVAARHALPKTGESTSLLSLFGLGVAGLGLSLRRRRP